MRFQKAGILALMLLCQWAFAQTDNNGSDISNLRDNGVILLYHHVSDSTPASTSISPKQFHIHMQYLSENHYVMALPDMIAALKNGTSIPDKAVAITFDDGYANILENADPILKIFNFPYTIFINPEQIGKQQNQLSWEQVKRMAKTNVSFANHTNSHHHMLKREDGESEQHWLARNTEDVMSAEQKIEQELGYSLKLFAYPYGEFNNQLKQHLSELGYVGFGQQSGAIASYSDFGALPRFPAAGIYANLAPLKTKLNSLALALKQESKRQFELGFEHSAPSIAYENKSEDIHPSQLQCFFKSDVIKPLWQDNLMQVKLDEKLKPGRHRINCTAPSIDSQGRYYWFSHPWFVPTQAGGWLD